MAVDEKSLMNLQTGWIKWQSVKVILETERLLICEVNVENVSEYCPSGIVKVTLGGKESIEEVFKFELKPLSTENIALRKDLPLACDKIIDVIIDEE